MNIANKNIDMCYGLYTYYKMYNGDSFKKVNERLISAKNRASKKKFKKTTIEVPVNWDAGKALPINSNKNHDWFTFAFKGNTDSFTNMFKFEDKI